MQIITVFRIDTSEVNYIFRVCTVQGAKTVEALILKRLSDSDQQQARVKVLRKKDMSIASVI